MEKWKDIAGYEGLYQISNHGRVKSLKKWDVSKRDFSDHTSILHPTDNGRGYLIIGLRKGRRRKNHYIHRLVADAFVENPCGKCCVNHKDYDKYNNHADNLEWCSQKENVNYSVERMRHPKSVSHTNTGHRYITRRKNRFRVTISKKEYGTCASISEAIKMRDAILEEVMPDA